MSSKSDVPVGAAAAAAVMSTAVSPPPDPASSDAPAVPGTSSSNFTLLYIIIAVLAGVILYMAIRHGQSVLADWRQLQAGGDAEAEASGRSRLGLSVDDIAALPTFTYRARAASASASPHGGGRSSRKGRTPGRAVECVVCLQEMVDGDVVRVLPACRHFFHGGCIDAWLCAHSTCPVCRAHPEPERVRLAEVAMSPPLPQLQRCGVSLERPPTASRVLEDILARSPLRNSSSCSTSGFGSPRLHFGSRTPSPTPQVYGRVDDRCSKSPPPGMSEIVFVPSMSVDDRCSKSPPPGMSEIVFVSSMSPSPMRSSPSRQLCARSLGTLESIGVIASASPSPVPIREDGGGSLSKSQ